MVLLTNFPLRLGLNLWLIIAKQFIYTASRKREDYYWDAFTAILTNNNIVIFLFLHVALPVLLS